MQAKSGWAQSFCASRLAAPVAFFSATWVLVSVVRVDATLHLDTARDLLIARDCVLGGVCGAGPRSSFGGWTQGALWSHVLELRELLGLGLGALEEVARLTLAVAAALVPVAARSLGRTPNALTWTLWFPATLLTIGYPTLWNPTLLPLALGLFCVAFLHATRTRSSLAFVAAAATLALAVDLHVVSVLLVPVLVGATVACAARPLVAVPTTAIVAVIVHGVSSPRAFAANWPLVVGQAPLVGVGLAVAVVGGVAVRRRLSRLGGRARATVGAASLCIYLLGLLPLLALLVDHPLHSRYLAPLVTPAAILVSTHSSTHPRVWVRITGTLLVLVGYLAFAVGEHILNSRFRLTEAERVGGVLYSQGFSYGDLYRHLRGPDVVHLLATLAALEPPDHRQSTGNRNDLLVLRTTRQQLPRDLPADWIIVELNAQHVAAVMSYNPWIRLEPFEVCRVNPTTCVVVNLGGIDQHASMLWADRAHRTLPGFRRPDRGERVYYRISLRADVSGPARLIHLLPDGCESWQVELDGASSESRSLRVEADGRIHDVVFSVIAGPGCRWWLPPFAEAPEGSASAILVGGS